MLRTFYRQPSSLTYANLTWWFYVNVIVLRATFFEQRFVFTLCYPVQFVMSLTYAQKDNCLSFQVYRTKATASTKKHGICLVDAEWIIVTSLTSINWLYGSIYSVFPHGNAVYFSLARVKRYRALCKSARRIVEGSLSRIMSYLRNGKKLSGPAIPMCLTPSSCRCLSHFHTLSSSL